ncbi:MAG: HD domain-containing protein [Candidatus Omnitrophica bacterium]|nr:HD domain-containing protein [Candidatus Omnitrophota bacterium]
MNLSTNLKKIPYLEQVSLIASRRKTTVWLVGGFLRDIYLKKKKDYIDFDFCVENKTRSLACDFAKKIEAKFIVLDKQQQSYRVVKKLANKIYTYDFTALRGVDFKDDLSLRDFSINTLAIDLTSKNKRIIDYYGGRNDLKSGIIRIVQKRVLLDDPLRILRGFSFMANYRFRIEAKTIKEITRCKKHLSKISGERVGCELMKIFAADNCFAAIKKADALGVLDALIPDISKCRGVIQGGYHHLDVWKHSLETLRQFEILQHKIFNDHKDVAKYISEDLAQGRKRSQIIKLACLLHDIGKPVAKKKKDKKTIFHKHEKIGRDLITKIAYNLRLSSKETETLKRLIFWHLRPGYLADQITPSKRAVYRFFRDTDIDGAAVILLSLADWRATRGPLTDYAKRRRHEKIMIGLVDWYFADKKKKPLVRIIDGYGLMKKFNLLPSPLIGKILKKVDEEYALGHISSKTQAYAIARKLIGKQ